MAGVIRGDNGQALRLTSKMEARESPGALVYENRWWGGEGWSLPLRLWVRSSVLYIPR